jgi:hypothetical protein
MKKKRNEWKTMYCIGIVILLVIQSFLLLASITFGKGVDQDDFILPPWGGGMVHCTPQLTDNIRLPVPIANATHNVGEVWYRHDFGGEKYGTYGNGIAGNGRIAASSFGLYDIFGNRLNRNDNLIIYDYFGNRLWSSGYWRWFNHTEFPWSLDPTACGSVPMIDCFDRVVACDMERIILVNAFDHHNIHVDWVSYFPPINLSLRHPSMPAVPLSPNIVENKTIIVPTFGGSLFAFDVRTGARLAYLSLWDNSSNVSYHYGTQNSVCVQGNRVYLTTQFPPPNILGRYRGNISGRLYAIDVDPDAINRSDILKVAWYYSYPGQGQASPTLINNTVYFDAFNGNYTTLDGSNRNPRIYAVYTNGTLRWERTYPNITAFSFAMDPRGGFWYNDMGVPFYGGGGRKLVHFSTEDGRILEELNVSALLHDPERVYPVSCMTIAGTATYPIMIISANHFLFRPGKYIIAINLSNREVLWKVPIESPMNFNTCNGQYTILNESGHTRVLFSTMTGGVMAIGSIPKSSQVRYYSLNSNTVFDNSLGSHPIHHLLVFIRAMIGKHK